MNQVGLNITEIVFLNSLKYWFCIIKRNVLASNFLKSYIRTSVEKKGESIDPTAPFKMFQDGFRALTPSPI